MGWAILFVIICVFLLKLIAGLIWLGCFVIWYLILKKWYEKSVERDKKTEEVKDELGNNN